MRNKLIKLANHLDNSGLIREASFLDNIIVQIAQEEANQDSFNEMIEAGMHPEDAEEVMSLLTDKI
jgi:hypothetical protein